MPRAMKESGIEWVGKISEDWEFINLIKEALAPYDGLCGVDMHPIETSQIVRFLMYSMLSSSFVEQVDAIKRDRIKMPKINQDELGNIRIMIPSLPIQKKIADCLNETIKEIDIVLS